MGWVGLGLARGGGWGGWGGLTLGVDAQNRFGVGDVKG